MNLYTTQIILDTETNKRIEERTPLAGGDNEYWVTTAIFIIQQSGVDNPVRITPYQIPGATNPEQAFTGRQDEYDRQSKKSLSQYQRIERELSQKTFFNAGNNRKKNNKFMT